MAIEYNYDGPPSLEIYQDFIRTTTDGGLDQNVAIVAQHYDVFKADLAADTYFNDYAYGAQNNGLKWEEFKWEEQTGPDTVEVNTGVKYNKIDENSISVVFKDASVSQATLKGTLGDLNSNLVVLDSIKGIKDDSLQEPVNVGDMVSVKVGNTTTIAQIVGLEPGDLSTTPEVTPVPGLTNKGTGTFNLEGEYSGASSRLYYIQIKKVSESTVILDIDTEDGTDSEIVTITGDAKVKLANSGMTISVATWNFSEDDYYQVKLTSDADRVVNKVRLSANITGDEDAEVEISFGKRRTFSVERSQYEITDTGVSLSDVKVSASFGGNKSIPSQVICGKYYIEFRAISSKYTDKLEYITYDSMYKVGYTGIENPMGAMVAVALKGGRGVYCTAVESDTVAAYRKAFVVLSKSSNAYAIVLGSTKPEVIIEGDTFVTAQADPGVANYKIMYYGLDNSQDAPVLDYVINSRGEKEAKQVLATVKDGVLTLENGNDYTGFITANVKPGDVVRINYTTDSYGVTSYDEFKVESVTSANTVKLNNTNVTIPVQKVFSVHRELTGSDLVKVLKNRVYTTNHRSYCVFGDGLVVDGIEKAPAWLIAALPAGMRAGEYCQRPISNLAYSGVQAVNTLNLNAAELKDLASRGVWILANNADGSTVYNYHQLSTDMSDKKLQEQSYTTNFDNVSGSARALLAPYYGNSNISEDFLQQLYADLAALLSSKTTNAPSTEVGPQLLRYENLSLTQDAVNQDHVYMEVDYYMPAPFNHVTLRQRLM